MKDLSFIWQWWFSWYWSLHLLFHKKKKLNKITFLRITAPFKTWLLCHYLCNLPWRSWAIHFLPDSNLPFDIFLWFVQTVLQSPSSSEQGLAQARAHCHGASPRERHPALHQLWGLSAYHGGALKMVEAPLIKAFSSSYPVTSFIYISCQRPQPHSPKKIK